MFTILSEEKLNGIRRDTNKTNMNSKIYLAALMAGLFFMLGCSAGLTKQTLEAKQPLNQVSEFGTKKGSIPPDFAVIATEGKAVVLGNFLRDEKPVIIYFFATWCPYCHQDLTALSKVYKNYEDKVSIIAISLDLSEGKDLIKEYRQKYPELQSVMFAPGTDDILIKYQVIRTTTKFAIGKDGKIMYAGFGAFDEEQWKILLDALSKWD